MTDDIYTRQDLSINKLGCGDVLDYIGVPFQAVRSEVNIV